MTIVNCYECDLNVQEIGSIEKRVHEYEIRE